MPQANKTPVFETRNVDLASYLILEGIELLNCVLDPNNPNIVIMRFWDARMNCLDLERLYLSSNYKRYRDINKYLLDKIHSTKRSI